MLIYGKSGILFTCREKTCLLNNTFNLVIFSDYSAITSGIAHSVGFAVPVHYVDFIKTISSESAMQSYPFSLDTHVEEIFKFSNFADQKKLQEFVNKQSRTQIPKKIMALSQGSKRL